MNKLTTRTLIVLLPVLFVAVVALSGASSCLVADAAGLTDMVTPKTVEFYESNIAQEPFISSMSNGTRASLKSTYNVNDNKLNTILILQDLGARISKPQELANLSKMNDKQLFRTGKTLISEYCATKTPEENKALEIKFFEMLRTKA